MAIKDTNYITIQGWMINELKLKGNELIIYAVIYGFSQDGEQKFTGSLQYLADVTLSTKQGVLKNLKSLCEKGLLGREEKIINGVKFVEYYATKFNEALNKVEQGMQQSLTGGIKQSLTNITNIYNTSNNTKNNIESSENEIPPSPSSENKKNKKKYGEYENVLLADEEYDKLLAEIPNISDYIDKLSSYVASTGKKYQSHYATIRNWFKKDNGQKNTGEGNKKGSAIDEFIQEMEARNGSTGIH